MSIYRVLSAVRSVNAAVAAVVAAAVVAAVEAAAAVRSQLASVYRVSHISGRLPTDLRVSILVQQDPCACQSDDQNPGCLQGTQKRDDHRVIAQLQ